MVPLPHQEEELPYADIPKVQDMIEKLLTSRRMVFITAPTPENISSSSDKANINEARIIAALLKRIYCLTENYFDADKTVGIIVPYRNQIAMIRKEISSLDIPGTDEYLHRHCRKISGKPEGYHYIFIHRKEQQPA